MIKGVLFDKDGTLIEFNSLWIDSTHSMIEMLAQKYGKGNSVKKAAEIAPLIGLDGKEVQEHSFLASKTTEEIAAVIAEQLDADVSVIQEEVNTYYYQYVKKSCNQIKPIGDIKALFQRLKKLKIKIGVVTADNYDITAYTLQHLAITEYVDFIATADCYKKKPNQEAMDVFCEKFQLRHDEVIHIGDTPVDMEFSKHGLFGIGVLSGVGTVETLKTYTPYVLPSVQELFKQHGHLF